MPRPVCFLTICAHDRACLFGSVSNDDVVLTRAGEIALECWNELPVHFPHMEAGPVVVMPNHVHGIAVIIDGDEPADPVSVGARHASPLQPRGPAPASLGAIVAAYKSAVTRLIRENLAGHGTPIWQRGYYEHVVRDQTDYNHICLYIAGNPLGWESDEENPAASRALPRHRIPREERT